MPTTLSRDQEVLDSLLKRLMREQGRTQALPEFFEDFAADTLMRGADLSKDEIRRGKVDGGNDGGIDFAFVLSNGVLVEEDSNVRALAGDAALDVVMISCTSKRGFEETQIQKIEDTVRDLLRFNRETAALRRRYNRAVLAFFQRFREAYTKGSPREFRFRIVYAARSRAAGGSVVDRADEIGSLIRESFSAADVSLEFADSATLFGLHQAPAKFDRNLRFDGQVITTRGAYVCLVRLRDFVDFITEDNRLLPAMLEENVRDYQGNVEVNKAIRETLDSEATTEFWWLNNGVTILTSDASVAGDHLRLDRPQIVNGLQTTFEIYNHFGVRDQGVDDPRHVIARVIQATDEPLRDQVIRATNSQTAIAAASLWATDELQRKIEQHLLTHGFYYDRRKNYYKNQGRPREKIVTIPGLAQALTAMVLLQPDNARARPSTLLKNKGRYRTVFNPQQPLDVYLRAVELMAKVDRVLQADGALTSADRNNFRFHVAARVASVAGKYRQPDVDRFLAIDVDTVTVSRVNRALVRVQKAVDSLVGPRMAPDRVSKSPTLVDLVLTGRLA